MMKILNPALSLQEIVDATSRIAFYISSGIALAIIISMISYVPDPMFMFPIGVFALILSSIPGAIIADIIFVKWEKAYNEYDQVFNRLIG
jgi:hypothetical protein